jgi:hypothetical protein
VALLPSIGEPQGQLADRRRRQIRQQLRQVTSRIDAVPATGAGHRTQDCRRLAAALVPDEQTIFCDYADLWCVSETGFVS